MFPRFRHTALFLLLAGTAQAASLADWASTPVPIKPGDKPDIVTFALPLAQAFDDLAHCLPGLEGGEGEEANVHIDSKNGFAICESGSGHLSEFAYWKRNNGHYLVGMAVTWNDISWEGDEMKNLVHFYDFDPKAAEPVLKPEESMSRTINAFRNEDYFIHLPRSGTHLVLQQFEGAGGATHYLAWDGERFADTPVTSLPQAEKPAAKAADKGKPDVKKTAPAKADDKGKTKDKPRDKPEAVYAIGQAYRAGKQLAEQDATRMFLDIRNVWHTSPETTRKIEYLFAEEAHSPYLIYVHHEGMGTLSYEEYLADKDGGLLFWFQKLEDDTGKWEYRLYFDGDKVVYHDIRKDGGKPQTGTGLPKKHRFGAGEGKLSMQRSFQALMTAFAAQMPTN
ncbi:MAG: hypothetical protein Q4A06_09870 [Cardiobacteriaceae bacterium]|nr:hypothetical protein [Cardiobacteriaceae bacterium]